MKMQTRTKEQLSKELEKMRQRVAELEKVDAERKQSQEALRESEERYRLFTESVSDVIWTMDMDLRFTYISPSTERMRGYSVEESMAQSIEDYLSPESLEVARQTFTEELAIEEMEHKDLFRSRTLVLEQKCKDGSTICTESRMTFLRDSDSKAVGILGITRDITERKRAEDVRRESEERYKAIFSHSLFSVYVCDLKGNFLDVNDATLDLLGYTREEIQSLNFSSLLDEEELPVAQQILADVKRTGSQNKTVEFSWRRKGGDYVRVETESAILYREGKPYAIQGIAKDVTDSRKAEEALRESEEKLRLTFESITDGIVVTDLQGKIVDMNEAAARKAGMSREEVINKDGLSLLKRKEHKAFTEMGKQALQGDVPIISTERTIFPSFGNAYDADLSLGTLHDSAGKPTGYVAVIRDVTERKRAEQEKLQAVTERAAVIDAIGDGLLTIGMDGKILSINPAFERLSGYTEEELKNKDAATFIPRFIKPEEQERLSDIFGATLKGDIPATGTFTLLSRNGKEITILGTPSFISDEEGKPTTIILTLKDITDIRRAEEVLKESEEKLRLTFESITDGIVVTDLQGKIVDMNKAAVRMAGMSREEIINKDGLSLLKRKEHKDFIELGKQALQGDVPVLITERKMFPSFGNSYNADLSLGTLHDSAGNPTGYVAVIHDVTERKRAEQEKLQAITERAAVVDAMGDGLLTIGMDGKILSINPAFERLSGYKEDEFKNKDAASLISRFIKPEEQERLSDIFGATLKGDIPESATFTLLDPEGREIPIFATTSFMLDEEGKPATMIIMLKDITDIIQAEEARRESEERYNAIFNRSLLCVYVSDFEGNFLDANDAALDLLGYTREDIHSLNFASLLDDKYVPEALQIFDDVKRAGSTGKTAIVKLRKKDGDYVLVETETTLLYQEGKPYAIQGIAKDITDRQRVEKEKLQAITERAAVIDAMGDGLITIGTDGKILSINPAFERLSGITEDEFKNKDAASLIPRFIKPEEQERLSDIFSATLKGVVPEGISFTVVDQEGREIPTFATTSFMLDKEGKPTAMIIMLKDITDIIQAEEAQRESEERYKAIFNHSLFSVYVCDLKGNFLDANDATLDTLGYTREEIHSLNFASLLDEEELPIAQHILADVKRTGSQKKTVEFKLRKKDGDYVLVETESAIINQHGKPYAVQGISKDITDRKQAQQALQESEEKYRLIAENVTDVIFTMDMNLRFTYISPSITPQRGYSVEEAMALGLEKTLTPASLEIAANTVLGGPPEEYLDEKKLHKKWTMELEMYCKDGSTIWTEAETTFLYDAEGKEIGIMGVARDITDRKRAEEELRDSEEKYRTVLETMEEGYYEVDLAGNFTFFNDSLCRIIGYPPDEVMGLNNRKYMSNETAKAVYEIFNRVYRTGEPDMAFGWELIRKDGTKSFVEASISLIRRPSGEPVGFRGIIRDITDRKRAEEALKKSEEKLRAMFESITDGIVVTDLQGIILEVNDVAVQMSGLSREEIIGKDGFSLIPQDDRNKVAAGGKKIVRGETGPVRMEHEISPKVGVSSTTNLVLGTMHDSEGNPTGFVAIAQDFTERKKAENALKASEAKYRDLVESISDIIYSVDANGVTTYISPVVESVLGYTPSELIGDSFADFMYQEDLKSATEGFMNTLSGNTQIGEFRVVTKSGEIRWVRSSNHPVFEEDRVIGVTGVITDITERKRAEEALRASEEKMRITFESMSDAVAVIDLEGRFVQVNETTSRISGYTREELMGRNILDTIIAKKDRDKIAMDMAQTLGEGDALGVRSYTLVTKDGREFDAELSTAVLRDSSGNISNFVGVARDVTERKRAEQERERLLAELEDKSKELEQLLFISSHDLRSPLVNIQGFAKEMELSLQEVRSVLEEDIPPATKEKLAATIDEDITDSLNYILASTSKIDTLLTGLLKVSRLGRATLTIEKLNMKDLIADVVGSFEFQTREAGVKLEVGRLPQCRGDRAQINQVFSNLIDNALKYLNPERPGTIRIYGRKEDSNVVYTVEDNGIGIAPEHQETVFQIFQRVDTAASPGEGLGLTIVRRILERHGGKTWLESEPGKGSRFHVALPIRD